MKTRDKIIKIVDEVDQAAREIYYALSYLEENHPARANLKQALLAIGVFSPGEVGLSDSALKRKTR